jgi:DNA invertase Pin-like site-specific DNA recombinase
MKATLYARVSTNEQRKESIDDQLRECRELCRRHGFDVVAEFCDRARSGNEASRPGYQQLLRTARRRECDVIVAHELSRLWRSESEMHAIKEELEYLCVHVVTDDGIDTRIAGMDILIAIKGAMAKQELRQIAHRTHRALKGLALDGRSAGGKCYGYISATGSGSGRREINDTQAREVRRIFSWYAAGRSPRWIADRLNEERIASPGSEWHRTSRRQHGKWLASAIHGDTKRGSGILNNQMYIGRYVWNRRRSRKRLKSGKREYLLRPKEEWIVISHPELRIVSEDLWGKVKARQREQAVRIGARVRLGLSKHRAQATGTYPKYLLSGIVRCGVCGSNLVVSGPRQAYVCASRVNGGLHACANKLLLPRVRLEKQLLHWIHGVLVGDDATERLLRAWRVRSGGESPDSESAASTGGDRQEELRDEISNLVDAIAHGALRSSPTLAERLAQAELKLAAEEGRVVFGHGVADAVSTPQSAQFYAQFVSASVQRLEENARETRATLSEIVGGGITLMANNDRRDLIVCCGLGRTTLPLAQLSRTFIAVQSSPRNDFN